MTVEDEAVKTAALVGSFRVYANIRAVVYFLTLVHVMTSMEILAETEACLASTTMRADEINADIRAVSIVLDTLVNVKAGKAALVQLVAFVTRTSETAFGVYATLLAAIWNEREEK